MLLFGRLLGLYIVTFFVVSQAVSVVAFGEWPPSRGLLVGGALIVAGGLVVHFDAG